MAFYGPDWWHHHGSKIRVEAAGQSVRLEGSAAWINITHHDKDLWMVSWEVKHSQNEFCKGQVVMKVSDLELAFGIESPENFVRKQGQYHRDGRYLNIPNPGTSHDGDANVSIELDDKITEAICQAIKTVEAG